MVVASAYIVTHSAITISKNFGIAEAILGATILSIGTTLPELSVNMAAIKKRDIGLAIGDTIGSLVTNLTLILGISSIINPITISNLESFLLGFFVLVSIIILFLATRMRFDKWTGVVLISIYVAYILSLTVFA
jgi:cation:H+ antiporter